MLGHFRPLSLLILLAIIVVLFGTKKLRDVGGDLGVAIKNFRKGLADEKNSEDDIEHK